MLCAAFTLRWREGGEGGESHVTCMLHVTCTGSPGGDYDLRRGVPSSSFVLRGRARVEPYRGDWCGATARQSRA